MYVWHLVAVGFNGCSDFANNPRSVVQESFFMNNADAKKIQRKLVTPIIFALISSAPAFSADEKLSGRVEVKGGEVYLSVELDNDSDMAICVYYWPESRRVLDYSYNNFLLIVDSSGEIADYDSMRADIDYENLNNSVKIVPPNHRIEANYNISRIYSLQSGQRYTAYYYLEAYACRAYDKGWAYPTSPDFLRSLAIEYDNDLNKIKNRVKAGGFQDQKASRIYEMNPVEFLGPEKQKN